MSVADVIVIFMKKQQTVRVDYSKWRRGNMTQVHMFGKCLTYSLKCYYLGSVHAYYST